MWLLYSFFYPTNFLKIFYFIFLIRTVRNSLYHLYIWQLKEYRVDRILSYLRTGQGKRWIFHPISLLKWITLVVAYFLYSVSWTESPEIILTGLFVLLFLLSYGLEALLIVKEIITKKFRMPVWTLKTVAVAIMALLITVLLTFSGVFPRELLFVAPLVADKLLGPIIAVLFILSSIPTKLYRKKITNQAKDKIRQHGKLKVIGITGSYGKSSTKEYLAHILSTNYTVLKTPENINTEIGVAQTILNELKPEHEVFVVEMGAYKVGEIKAICEIVHPGIGIVTGINEQHIELFGSIENTMKAKYELLGSLPKGGIAIVNGNNERCLEMGEWAKKDGKEVIITKVSEENINENKISSCIASRLKIDKEGLEFRLSLQGDVRQVRVHLYGKHHVENILTAVAAAQLLKMELVDITKSIRTILPKKKSMNRIQLVTGVEALDDTYNSNPASVRAILEYMNLYKGKKVLVLMPLIELGDTAEEIHKELGKEIADVCDHVIVTNTNYLESFKAGLASNKKDIRLDIANGVKAAELLKQYNDKEDIIGFEGREAGSVLKYI